MEKYRHAGSVVVQLCIFNLLVIVWRCLGRVSRVSARRCTRHPLAPETAGYIVHGPHPLVGDPVHLLLGHAVLGDHVSAHATLLSKHHLADGTARLTAVPLHVLRQRAAMVVGDAADVTAHGIAFSWGPEKHGW